MSLNNNFNHLLHTSLMNEYHFFSISLGFLQGHGVECASIGELLHAIKVGFPPEKIVFDSPVKTAPELSMMRHINITHHLIIPIFIAKLLLAFFHSHMRIHAYVYCTCIDSLNCSIHSCNHSFMYMLHSLFVSFIHSRMYSFL